MGRLIHKFDGKNEMICRHEDCDTVEEKCPLVNKDNCYCLLSVFNKLAEYEDADEQGLLLRLACKIGSPLYRVYKKPTKCTAYGEYKDDYSYSCEGCEQECDSSYVWSIYKYEADIKTIVCLSNEIGKTVFLTQAEAEQKLKEMESD